MSIINRETDYAIRIIRALAPGGIHTVNDICEKQCFKKPFAYKISKKLENAGIISVARGKSGGLMLACDTEKTTLFDVMRAVDTMQLVNECFLDGYICDYAGSERCNAHPALAGLQKKLIDAYKSVPLSTLV